MTTVRIGHSPDADDAFMFYALTAGKVKIPGVTVEHVLEDIESLNRRSRTAELDVTAVSFATYLLIADRYRMMDPGSSMGKGYGPILVAREPIPRSELENRVVAIPGKHTTSALLLSLYVGDPPQIEVAFDKIPQAVLDGQADLGLLIHEGQITHQKMGLTKVLDLGEAWQADTGLAGTARLDRLGLREHRRGARLRDALRARDRQGDVPALRAHVRQRLHAGARPGWSRRDRAPVRDGARQGADRGSPADRPDLAAQ